ncbi:GNAT family N-acetyltransferase [Ureibacillus sp. NPDC094379]
MIIRQVEIKDLPALLKIENAGFTPEEAATEAAFRERIENIPDTFFVAVEDGQVVGLINGPIVNVRYISDDLFETVPPNPRFGGHQTVLGVAVAPEQQGKGIASKLLKHLEDGARKAKRETVTLTCRAELISFYEKLGYKNEGKSQSEHGGIEWYNLVKEL